jgi:hypothetical protein
VRCEVREISWRDELDVMPYSEEDSIFISLMLHGGNGACDWASEMSHLYPLFPSLFLTFHRPINLPSYHFHNDTWVSPYYFPLYSF